MSESISNERLSKRNLWGYSMGGIGRDMAYQLVNTYLLTFITFTKGLSNTEFAMVGVIMVICRIFDGCNDPFMGSLIEITRTKSASSSRGFLRAYLRTLRLSSRCSACRSAGRVISFSLRSDTFCGV